MHASSKSEQVETLQFAHASATTAMTPLLQSSRVVIPMNDADAAAENAFITKARMDDAPKATGEAWAVGAALYWSAANSNFTTTSSGNTLAGHAAAAALSADATGDVLFNTFAA